MEKNKVTPLVHHLHLKVLKRFLVFWCFAMASDLCFAQNDPLFYTPGEDLAKKTAGFLFLKVETNKKEAYAGESIVAWYRLYVAVDIQGKLSKSPSFTGFASYDMEGADADAYEVKKIDGIPFRVYLVKQVQLFGLRPGIQRLEPVELEATIRYKRVPKEINDYITGSKSIDTLYNYTMKSAPVDFKINALPKDNTGSFSGAVGDFEISAFSSLAKLPAGKADTLHLVLRGSGNWHEVTVPAFQWPEGIEVFEPRQTENTNPYAIPVQGLRTIAYPLVFNKKGVYEITGPSFTFFNPVLKQYKTIRAGNIRIVVTNAIPTFPGKKAGAPAALTELFSRFAIFIFPVMALVLLGILFVRRKKDSPTGQKPME